MSPPKVIDPLHRLCNLEFVKTASVPALRMGAAFLQFVATVWIARVLGEQKAGDFFFWSAILMSLGQAATFGLDGLTLQQVPRHDSSEAIAKFLAPIRLLVVAFSFLLGIGLIGYGFFVQRDVQRTVFWFSLLPFCLAGIALCRINGEAMKGMAFPRYAIMYRQFFAGLLFLIGLAAMGKSLNSENALLCYSIAFGIVGFAGPWGPRFCKLVPRYSIPTAQEASRELKRGFPIFISAVFITLNYVIPLAILERLHSSESVSFLTTTYRIFMIFDLLALAVHSIVMPQLSRAGHESNWSLVGQIYRSTIRSSLIILGVPLIVSLAGAQWVMAIFGPGFVEAAPILQVFFIFSAVSLCMGPANELVLMMGDTGKMAAFSIARMFTTIVLSLALIPTLGAVGMAIAVGVGLIVQKGLCLWHFYRNPIGNAGNNGENPV